MALAAVGPGPAWSADDKKTERVERRIQALEQRFEAERNQWQTERADLQKKLADQGTQIDKAKSDLESASSSLGRSEKEVAGLRKSVADLTAKMAAQKEADARQLADAQAALTRFGEARQQERVATNARYETQSKALAVCTSDNNRLLALGHELLIKYRDKGVMDSLRQEDPVLGFGDVEMFNRVQDYQERIDAQRFGSPSPAADAH